MMADRGERSTQFDLLVGHVRQSWINSGRAQAEIVAAAFALDYGVRAFELLRAAGQGLGA